MQILNATQSVKCVMTDRGDLISIPPGELSPMVIASRNLVISAIQLGSPSQIGIVVSGSYETEIISKITGAVPYIYGSIEEAKAKLIDPTINYAPVVTESINTTKLQLMIDERDVQIRGLEDEIVELNSKIATLESNDRIGELEGDIQKFRSEITELNADKVRLQGMNTELNEQINSLTQNLNSVRSELGKRTQEQAAQSEMINKLTEQNNELTMKLNSASEGSSKELSEATELIESLKANLKESVDQIDSMKASFNAACQKFNLYLDESGEWQMDK